MTGYFRFHIEYFTEEGALVPEDGFVLGTSFSDAISRVCEARSDEDIETITLTGLEPDELLTVSPEMADAICKYDYFESVYWPIVKAKRAENEAVRSNA